MYIPRIQSNLSPLLTSPLSLNLSPTPPLSPSPPSPSPPSPSPPSFYITVHLGALRFTFHLTLISLFETLFFWQFISKSEDSALVDLVNGYTTGIMNSCANLTVGQRAIVTDIFDLFIDPRTVDAAGALAAANRATFNHLLLRNSWLYMGGILTLFASLASAAIFKKRKVDWVGLVGENLALVTVLGLYEWMFFTTVILRYKAISIPELDKMVVDEFQMYC
jgi:hypothetical protein